ncbi:hypothetical protein K431DRAFT_300785 [Polychaeton citri CBS 116435]|uniref:Uncharacterized protein n=1 Tax=Polychaeton citri CBS 116435 TaxID=1314669 RepID=A0A9P4QGG1_9PEZI|nr:hypothetical protein K431DRAFT_300785 [Polychaeton citri CBS 116435]
MVEMAKADSTVDVEGLPTTYTGHFPEDLPPRTGPPPAAGWKGRLRSRLFTFSLSSYSIINTPNGQARVRHMVMIAILVLRTASSALSILSAILKKNVAGIIIYSLLAVLSFWFTATCLAIIGDAAGDRTVKSVIIKRWHFDFFLGFCLIIHVLLIVLFFFGLGGLGLELAGIGMWLLILGVAWIAGWEPEFQMPTYQRSWVT